MRKGAHGQEAEELTKLKIPSIEELEHFKKPALRSFLKERGLRQTGTRKELLNVAKLYATRPVIAVLPPPRFPKYLWLKQPRTINGMAWHAPITITY